MTGNKISSCQERLTTFFDSLPDNDSTIASTLGVSKQTISAWKLGTRSPKKTMVERIAAHYNLDIAWIMGYDVPMHPPASAPDPLTSADQARLEAMHQNPRLGLLFDRARNLDEDDIAFMEKYVNAILKERDND